jgi:hypothetical protein
MEENGYNKVLGTKSVNITELGEQRKDKNLQIAFEENSNILTI